MLGKLLFGGQIELVFACQNCTIVFRQSIFYQQIVLVGAQQDSNCRVLIGRLLVPIVLVYIHLQLTDVFVCDLVGLQFNDNETAEQPVVKYQVCEEFIIFEQYPLLAGNE